jgi:two-component sensor histidine kinase
MEASARSSHEDRKSVGLHAVELFASVAEVCITEELARRGSPEPDYLQEKLAIKDLARQMAVQPAQVLPHLVRLALDICRSSSAGTSLYESAGSVFRWHHVTGALAKFNGGTTPREFSPCGICLDQRAPVLMERPERAYSWIRDAGITVPEVLLVPLFVGEEKPLGTLWIVAHNRQHFNAGHARVMSELAAFAGLALRMNQGEASLKRALESQETLTKEMSHRVKNLFSIADSILQLSAKSAVTPQDLARSVSGRLQALSVAHGVVKRTLNAEGVANEGTDLAQLIATILRPYHSQPEIKGPSILLGAQASNTLALVFHELATNAAKYGALSVDDGLVRISWEIEDNSLIVKWREKGGPEIKEEPPKKGFGSMLAQNTIGHHGGAVAYAWDRKGLSVRMSMPMDQVLPLIV